MATAKSTTTSAISIRPSFVASLAILFLAVGFNPITLFLVMGSVLLHETAHALFAWRFGVPVNGIVINALGVALKRPFVRGIEGAMIAMAGPSMTLSLALCSSGFVARFNWCLFLISIMPLPFTDLGHAWQAMRKR